MSLTATICRQNSSLKGRKESELTGDNDSAVEGRWQIDIILLLHQAEGKMVYATLKFTMHISDDDDKIT